MGTFEQEPTASVHEGCEPGPSETALKSIFLQEVSQSLKISNFPLTDYCVHQWICTQFPMDVTAIILVLRQQSKGLQTRNALPTVGEEGCQLRQSPDR